MESKGMGAEKAEQLDIWMFHESEAPKGRMFQASEVSQLKRQGWVDTPAKFGKGIRIRYRKKLQALRTLWSIMFPRT
jgi:hypothetical protein